ncbi:hypothetical protein PLICRDRAFT_175670 [Plicaturopsis crispa FD-325 SS-3]|nr:hypothetical protein PLICRDRAFT_175670 [Plicaturopsis crispa FD-325 SS-3]
MSWSGNNQPKKTPQILLHHDWQPHRTYPYPSILMPRLDIPADVSSFSAVWGVERGSSPMQIDDTPNSGHPETQQAEDNNEGASMPVTRRDLENIASRAYTAMRDLVLQIPNVHSVSDQHGRRNNNHQRLHGRPIRRSENDKEFAKSVRERVKDLVGEVPHLQPAISAGRLAAFQAQWDAAHESGTVCPPCCSFDNFRIDLVGGPHSAWNQSAAQVFASDYILVHGWSDVTWGTRARIVKAFHGHVKALKAKRIVSRNTRTERDREKARKNRAGRKHTLFDRRLSVALDAEGTFRGSLQRHVPILQLLGPDGMSSDEEEGPPGTRVFQIYEPRFRADQVTVWLRTFDSIHHLLRSSAPDLRGNWPRSRNVQEDDDNDRPPLSRSNKFVPGLPVNAYNAEWLRARHDVSYAVRPSQEPFDFNHDARFIE